MALKTVSPDLASLYETDSLLWMEETGRLLRAGRLDELDIEHLAEEIEDMARSQRRELESRVTVLLLHLQEPAAGAKESAESAAPAPAEVGLAAR